MLNYELQAKEHYSELEDDDINGSKILRNPFPGLRPFSIDECHLFFGREGQVDEVLVKLAENRFVTVMGYSGSGKSSLMYCGLIPILYGGFMAQEGANWNVVVSRPGVSPVENLADSLLRSDKSAEDYTQEEYMVNKMVISSLLKSNARGLIAAIEKRHKQTGENTLILIDQFEELFRYGDDHELFEEARIYVNLLLEACKSSEVPIYLAITMRSDYVGECAKFPGLTQLINQSNYLVPQMTRDQKRVAVEGPVAVGGGKITRRLVKRLLNEVGDNQDQLPILQHALMRTWDYWVKNREENESLDIRHYNAVGKISEALSQHANEAYDELSSREKEIAETLFKALTQKTSGNFGLRKPAKISLVAELAGANEEEVIAVVDKFRQPGRSFLMPAASVQLHSESMIEISHESLMRIWTRLRAWVDEEYESAQMYRRLSEAAAMYQIGRTGLWRPPDLQLALNWQQKQRPTRAWAQRYDEAFERAIVFLDTSRITYEAEQKNQEMLQKRLLKRTKIVAVVLGIAAVISIIFFVYAVTQSIEAQRQAAEANKQKEIAETQRDVAEENRLIADQRTEEARQNLARALKSEAAMRVALEDARQQRLVAQQQFVIAQKQRNIADSQKVVAQGAREFAEQEFERAEKNYSLANKLLYQSVAQSMAVKSLNIEENNLKGLLAQQAYVFNKRYEGRVYDPYIYEGLYNTLAQIQGKSFSTLPVTHRNAVRSLVFANNSDNFFSTGSAGRVIQSSISNPSVNKTISANDHPNRVLTISHTDEWLLTGTDSSAIQAVNLNTGELHKIKGHTSYINDLEFIPGEQRFVSVAGDRQIMLGDPGKNSTELFKQSQYEYKSISSHPAGDVIAGGTLGGKAVLINMSTKEEKAILDLQNTPIHAVQFSPDGMLLAIGDEKGLLRIWDMKQGKIIKEFTGHKGRISDIEFSANGKLMASASLDKTMQMWVLDKLDELPVRMTDNDAYVWNIEFSKDGQYLLAACGDGEIRKWPTEPSLMAKQICENLERNMTEEEWKTYVANDIPFENTCISLLLNDY